MEIKIMVACHKPYEISLKKIYIPIEVGAENHKEHFLECRDNDGVDNISRKNSSYCELTALYWAWKNMNYDAIGLCHYRRFFSRKRIELFDNIQHVLTEKDIVKLLDKYDFILPKKTVLQRTNYQHSIHCYDDGHMDITRDVIEEFYPQYLEAFDYVMNINHGHFLNMFIAKKDWANKYFEFLFGVLSKVEERYVFNCPHPASGRVFGYIGESLLDVFVLTEKLKYIERPLVYLERPNLFKRLINKIFKRK